MFPCFAWSVLFICLVLICEEKKKKTGVTGSNVVVGIQIVKKLRLNRAEGRGGEKKKKEWTCKRNTRNLSHSNYSRNREKEKIYIYMRRKMLIRFTENPFFFFFNDRSKFQQN